MMAERDDARTMQAWRRTALAFAGVGLIVLRTAHEGDHVLATTVAAVAVLAAAGSVLGGLREPQVRDGVRPMLATGVAVALALAVLAAAVELPD